MRTYSGSVRDVLQDCSLAGMRLPDGTYPHNPKWRYRSSRDRERLGRMIERYRSLCDKLERAITKGD